MKKSGFTIIEIMIMIAISGILSAIIITSLGGALTRAKIAKTKMEMRSFGNTLQSLSILSGGVLHDFTHDWASYSPECDKDKKDWRNVPENDSCLEAWKITLNKIADANGIPRESLNALQRDAWGSPYSLDENEMESFPVKGNTDESYLCQRHDIIYSPGPDGVDWTDDEIYYGIPFLKCPENLPDNCPDQTPIPSGFFETKDLRCP